MNGRTGSSLLVAPQKTAVSTVAPSHHVIKLDWCLGAFPGHRKNLSGTPAGGKVTAITSDQEFTAAVKAAAEDKKALIVDFTAAWCGPCKMVAPHYEQLAKDHPNVVFLKLDIDQEACQKTVQEANVTGVPAFQKYVSGKRVATVVGADLQRLKSMVKS
eukprot:jgi/Mesvir1/28207/Mv04760-RA.1